MEDSFKHIEEHFKQSLQDYSMPAKGSSFANVLAATNKKLFFKFVPGKFNVFYLSAATVVTVGSVPLIISSVNSPKEEINKTVIITDSVNHIVLTDSNTIYSKDTLKLELITVEPKTEIKEEPTADTLNLTPPENTVASSATNVIPETIIPEEKVEEEKQIEPISVEEEKEEEELSETKNKVEAKTIEQNAATDKVQESNHFDSTVVIEKEDVLIEKSELKVKKQKVKKRGR